MADYLHLGQVLMRYLPLSKGSSSTVKLGKEGIEALVKKNPELGQVVAEFTEGIKNPTLEIAQKAQGNYAIAGFKIRSGETVLGKGAYSTSQGAKGIVEKMHVEKGDIITTISKEGEEVVTSSVSKKDLARAAQEKAKASEYMTREVKGLNGERILVRKLKNGNIVETTTRKNGTISTKVTLPNGKWYVREKTFTKTNLTPKEAKLLEKLYPGYCSLERVDKNIVIHNEANLYTKPSRRAKSGRISGVDVLSPDMDRRLLVKYDGVGKADGPRGYKISFADPVWKKKFYDETIAWNGFRVSNDNISKRFSSFVLDPVGIIRQDIADMIGESYKWVDMRL